MPSLFILAGEASGDRIGAALLADLKKVKDVEISGVGGEVMARQGVETLFPIEDLAVMGYADVIGRLPLLLWRAHQVVKAILAEQPDVVVLIDAQVFSQVVATRLRKRGFTGRILLYVAPAVWAWKPHRAKAIAQLYDEVLSVLPFEPAAMKRLDGPATTYVGHPALTRFTFRENQPSRGPVLLLPGSRMGELRRHMPLMRSTASALGNHKTVSRFAIPTLSSLHTRIVRQTANWHGINTETVSTETQRQQVLADAVAALSVSGTATLELALAGVPHVLTYIAEGAQVRMFRQATIQHIGLPNIIAGRDIVPEVLFDRRADPQRTVAVLSSLLDDVDARHLQVAAFAEIRALMEKGAPEAPLCDPVERVLDHFPRP